jgi:hypothetical protein
VAHRCRAIAVFGWKTAEKYGRSGVQVVEVIQIRRETLNQKAGGSIPHGPFQLNQRLSRDIRGNIPVH